MSEIFECKLGESMLTIEVGKVAGQADGAVTVHHGDTLVLVTACVAKESREGMDFVPLTVDYEERLYAAGKIPGGFIRREGRPTEAATLACRLVDRSVRPLLSKDLHRDVQIVVTVLSADQENDPDVLAVIGASAALMLSSIPFNGPIGAVRLGYWDGHFVLDPTLSQIKKSLLDLVVVGTAEKVVMVEAGGREIAESVVLEAIRLGQEANQEIIALQQRLRQACGKPKIEVASSEVNLDLLAAIASALDRNRLSSAIQQPLKSQREEALEEFRRELINRLGDTYSEAEVSSAFEAQVKAAFRARVLEGGSRPGGRSIDTIRPLSCEVGILPRTHGSGLFTRGQTQVLTIATLGSVAQEQRLDSISPEESKRFLHHYNFPPFSTGETKRIGNPGRREIGHGALAERALAPVVPSEKDFSYTIRLVSEVLSSNGSTSMASVCGASLSLMDAGVPIKAPVAGVAMGLITGEGGKYVILTDIEGLEDAYGDMDFKVAGTDQGITALQLDIKLQGISFEILEKALSQAREARQRIIEKMRETISSSRLELSRYAPRMFQISIDPGKIGAVIGPGGRVIRSIIAETKTSIDVANDGTVTIGSTNEEAAQQAIRIIEGLTREVEVGGIYTGKVTRLLNFGAMVEILPGKEGLVHISELADYHVPRVEDVVKVGDEVMVKVTEVDNLGRINLSRRAVLSDVSRIGGARVQDSRAPGHPSRKPYPTRPAPHSYDRRDAKPSRPLK